MRTTFLVVALAFGLATAASAAVTPARVGHANNLVTRVAEGCGPGFGAARGAGAIRCSTVGHVPLDTTLARNVSGAGPTDRIEVSLLVAAPPKAGPLHDSLSGARFAVIWISPLRCR